MNDTDIIIYVDKHPNLTINQLLDYLFNTVTDLERRTQLEIIGLSRLAGRHQIQGNHDQHKFIINKLRKEYGMWCD